MAKIGECYVLINIKTSLSLWQAIKLRLAGMKSITDQAEIDVESLKWEDEKKRSEML